MKNLDELMKQAQEMQKQMQDKMQEAQAQQQGMEYTGESGAGLAKVVLNGNYDVKKVALADDLLKESKELIEDLIAAAINDAIRKVEQGRKNTIPDLADSFNLPKDFKFPF